MSTKPLLTIQEVADFLKVSTKTIRRLLERGDMKGVRIGRVWRIRDEDLQAYVKRIMQDEKSTPQDQ